MVLGQIRQRAPSNLTEKLALGLEAELHADAVADGEQQLPQLARDR